MSHIHQKDDVVMSRYRIENYLAEGGMQEVYRAFDSKLERFVVVKTPKNESAHKRFKRSAQVSAKINHPNVAKTLDFNEGETSYLVEEFIEGNDLKTRLDQDFYLLDPHLAAHVAHHLVKAIAIAHRFDIFHRDLKPSNIMVSNDPNLSRIKLTDFGIAKMAEDKFNSELQPERVESSMTTSKTIVGAIPFMSPELIQTPMIATKSSDIWAIGAILYYLMTGEYPFGSGLNAVIAISAAQLPAKPPLFEKVQFQGLCHQLWKIIEKCLQKEPGTRPTADELVSEFSKVCYSISERQTGQIKNFIGNKTRGFISCHNGDNVFFHTDSFYSSKRPIIDMKVNFAKFEGSPNPRAFPVSPIKKL